MILPGEKDDFVNVVLSMLQGAIEDLVKVAWILQAHKKFKMAEEVLGIAGQVRGFDFKDSK